MSKQIPLATITMLVLSACCSTLSQGATSLATPSSATPSSATPSSATPDTAPLDARSAVVVAPSVVGASSIPANTSSIAATPRPTNNQPAAPVVIAPPRPSVTKPVTTPPVIKPVPVSPSKKISPPTIPRQKPVAKKSIRATPPTSTTPTTPTYNLPYTMNGESYTPLHNPVNLRQRGEATWYNKSQQGLPTINGEIYDVYGMTAAHATLPIPSYARVINLANRKSVVVRINDRGPFEPTRKVIELSFAAANKLGMVGSSNRKVEIIGLESEIPTIAKPKANISFHLMRERPANKPVTAATSVSKKPAVSAMAAGVYLQLGAFKTAQAAESFANKARTQLGTLPYPLTHTVQSQLHCVRVGPYPSPEAAQQAADEMSKQIGFKPLLKKVG